MNENINLVEILKDCPESTKLYSLVHGYVEFHSIRNEDKEFPIRICIIGNYTTGFTKDGKLFSNMPGECILFPSKEQRNWSKFKVKKPKFDPNTFQPFDRVLLRDKIDEYWACGIFSHIDERDEIYKFQTADIRYRYCIPYNEDTKHLVGTTEEAPEFYQYWEE